MAGLIHRGGLRANIVSGGTIRVGESITEADMKRRHRGGPNMSSIEPAVFSREWVAAWNCSDVEAILAHYADDVVFVSPLAATATGSAEVHGKDKLRALLDHSPSSSCFAASVRAQSFVWDDENCVLLILYVATETSGNLRKCELLRFGPDGLIHRGEAFVGAATP